MGVHVDEEILEKTGPELFKELYRVYPVADFEDYFKNGVWKDDVMRTDLVLIYAHAREAGAPYPPPLSEIKLPNLPKGVPAARPALAGGPLSMGVRPILATPVVRPPPAAGTAPAAAVGTAPAAGAAATAGSQATELRLIALFVAKWKLDATRTKLMLAKLTPARRRYVIQNFKSLGGDPSTALEQFIAKCEQTNAWAGATAPAATAPAAVAPPAAAGIKRPLTPTMSVDPSKRPRMMTPGVANTAAPLRPGTVAGARPALAPAGLTPRAVRPLGARPAVMTPRF